MNIALVDDEALDRDEAVAYLKEHIHAEYPEEESSLRLDVFTSGEEFIDGFMLGSYDLIILDIYMKGLSGLDTARLIRKKDLEAGIVFLTSSDEHILEGYRVFATGYFIKPLSGHMQDFARTFAYVFAKLQERRKYILLQVKGEDIEIPYRDIIYMDMSEGRQLVFHLSGQDISTYGSYAEFQEKLLADKRFLECHHRIIVNMDHVESMDDEIFLLKEGRTIPISRRKKHEAKIAYMKYLIGR